MTAPEEALIKKKDKTETALLEVKEVQLQMLWSPFSAHYKFIELSSDTPDVVGVSEDNSYFLPDGLKTQIGIKAKYTGMHQ